MPSLAEQYETKYPNTGCGEAQKQERMERIKFKEERAALHRTWRNMGIIVPRLPWIEEAK